jgi:glycosyltransferase involved in cell wall biosynthesis
MSQSPRLNIALFHNLPSGGAKRATYEQIKQLSDRGHQITEYTLATSDLSFLPLAAYVTHTYVAPARPMHLFPGRIPLITPYVHAVQGILYQSTLDRQCAKLAHEIDRQNFDLLFAADCQLTTIPYILRHLSTPTVFYMHSLPQLALARHEPTRVGQTLRQRMKNWYYYAAQRSHYWRMQHIGICNLQSVQAFVTNSHFAAARVEKRYSLRPKVIYLGINTDAFRPVSTARCDYLLAVGALTEGKGYHFIITALAAVPAATRPKLIIAANFEDPLERQAIGDLATEYGVSVEIRKVDNDMEMAKLYSEAQMLLFAPYDEALGLVALEAMACGTPVIGVGEGGLPETIHHGVTGLLVERDCGAFAQAIQNLLANQKYRDQLGLAGIDYVKTNWSWKRSVDELEDLFKGIVL